jgi:hypothetical protein
VNRQSGQRPFWLTFHRPPWQEQLPPPLRLALECQCGTFLLGAVIMLIRGQVAGAFVFLTIQLLCFTFLAGWREGRRLNSPYVWWPSAIFFTLMGFGLLIGSIFGDVS